MATLCTHNKGCVYYKRVILALLVAAFNKEANSVFIKACRQEQHIRAATDDLIQRSFGRTAVEGAPDMARLGSGRPPESRVNQSAARTGGLRFALAVF